MRVPTAICRFIRRSAGDARGAAAVEFALVLPVLVTLLFGILIYGIYLGAAHNLREIAAEAARASVAGISDDERATLARQRVNAALGSSLFRPGVVGVQVGPDPSDATLYTVTLSVEAKALGLTGLSGLVPMPPDILKSTVSVRRGGL